MKALLRKDLYWICTQLKLFLVMMALFCALPGGNFLFFGVLYSVLMTTTTLMSLDETSKWEVLALMLPYSRRQIVAEKYVLGWMLLAGTLAVSVIFRLLWWAVGIAEPVGTDFLAVLCVYASVALLIQAVVSPVNFRFGMTRGRILSITFIAVTAGVGAALFVSSPEDAMGVARAMGAHVPVFVLPLLAAALSAASLPLAVRGFRKRVER